MSPPSSTLEARALGLVDEALELPSERRADFVAEQAGDDLALRRRAMALLGATDRSSALVTGGAGLEADDEPPPERVGAYRLTGKIGQGGMGSVWRAERDAGDFTHIVAVKIIRSGLLSAPVIERFQRERQVLADLSHPNIARLFDGGQTADGRPYIVMELVNGRPITDWADDENLGVRRRVELMLAVCEAVGFAHRNLIVHRDLTPSNVLVTPEGAVKLIDFGIARPPEAQPAPPVDRSLVNLSLTPGFAAPERQTGAAASTLLDVYSLGRLLAALIEDVPGTDGELKAVIDRASAEEAEDRYPTAEALAEDLRAWLTGHPVAAAEGGRRYRLAKFVGRHRRSVAASAAGLVALIGALGVSLWAYGSAERAHAAEAERFDQVRTLANYMLFDLNGRLERTPGNTEARVRLAAEAQRYLTALAESPQASPEVRLETARGFIRLAQIQGVPPFPNFGEKDAARDSLERALTMLAVLREEGGDVAILAPDQARASAYAALLAIHGHRDPALADRRVAEAEAFLAEVPETRRDLDWYEAQRDLRVADLETAYVKDGFDPLNAAIARKEADMAAWPEALRDGPAEREDLAFLAYWRGTVRSYDSEGDRGVPLLEEALRLYTEAERDRPNDPRLLYWLIWTDYGLFSAAANADRLDVSSAALERARETLARLLRLETADQSLRALALSLDEAYAQDLGNQDRFDEAIAAQRDVIRRRREALAANAGSVSAIGDLAFSQATLGVIARKAADRDLACSSWRAAGEAWARLESGGELVGFHASMLEGVRRNLALCEQGRPVESFGPLVG